MHINYEIYKYNLTPFTENIWYLVIKLSDGLFFQNNVYVDRVNGIESAGNRHNKCA